jgi:hypothetical protein
MRAERSLQPFWASLTRGHYAALGMKGRSMQAN